MDDILALEYAALEAEFQCSYSDLDPALEGVGAQYRDIISEYVQKLNDIDSTIRVAIVQSNKEDMVQACRSGISLCKRFHDEMVSVPPEKFVAVKNLLPCFKVLTKVASIALILGGKKALSKCKNQTVQDAVKWVSGLSGWKSWVRDLLLAGKPGIRSLFSSDQPRTAKMGEGKLGKFARENAPKAVKAVSVVRSVKSIASTIGESLENSRYAKMIREEDKEGKNTRQTKYNAVLGQIEEMTAMYQDLINNADDIIASTNDPKAAAEAYCSMLPDWTAAYEASGMDYDAWLATSESEFYHEIEDWEPATELMTNTYNSVVTRNEEILYTIMANMWGAEDDYDKQKADRYARQGLRSAERYIAEVKAAPITAFENIEPILKFCTVVETFIMAVEFRYINASLVDNLIPDPLNIHDMMKSTVLTNMAKSQDFKDAVAAGEDPKDILADGTATVDTVSQILGELLNNWPKRIIKTYLNVKSFMKYYGTIAVGAYHTILKSMAFAKYRKEGIQEGDAKLNLARQIAVGQALRFKEFCEQTLKIPQSEYDAEKAKAEAEYGSLDSMLFDHLHTPVGPQNVAPATEADVSWMFAD